MKLFLCLISVFGVYTAQGQVVFPGVCEDVKTKVDFDATQYVGTWYEIERFFFLIAYNEDCVTLNYTLQDNGRVKVVNRGIIKGTSEVDESVGEAYIPDPNFPGKLLVTFGGPPSDYWVLDTDYKTYSVVWSCTDTRTRQAHTEITWILTRDRSGISDERRVQIYDLLKKYKIDTSNFQRTNQKDCVLL